MLKTKNNKKNNKKVIVWVLVIIYIPNCTVQKSHEQCLLAKKNWKCKRGRHGHSNQTDAKTHNFLDHMRPENY